MSPSGFFPDCYETSKPAVMDVMEAGDSNSTGTNVHLNICQFKCEICDLSCTSKDVLVRHLYSHRGEKPKSLLITWSAALVLMCCCCCCTRVSSVIGMNQTNHIHLWLFTIKWQPICPPNFRLGSMPQFSVQSLPLSFLDCAGFGWVIRSTSWTFD